jgi:LysR family transcriptional regulator, nitrogen assimilation regulatory protein
VLDEPLYLVSGRAGIKGRRLRGPPIALADVAGHDIVIPSRPHSMRMLLETALANEGRRAKVALEIESIPAILDLVRRNTFRAVLSLNAIASSEPQDFYLRPIGKPPLNATLWIATSAQRPRGALLDRSTELVHELMLRLWPRTSAASRRPSHAAVR